MNETYYKYVRNGEETKETAGDYRWKVNSGLKKWQGMQQNEPKYRK